MQIHVFSSKSIRGSGSSSALNAVRIQTALKLESITIILSPVPSPVFWYLLYRVLTYEMSDPVQVNVSSRVFTEANFCEASR
jgi:hypothetical protein